MQAHGGRPHLLQCTCQLLVCVLGHRYHLGGVLWGVRLGLPVWGEGCGYGLECGWR
jgi:hypothetical protein